MYGIINGDSDCFVGMVYHAECGWHCGFAWHCILDHEEIIKYSTKEQAEQQKKFMEEVFHEKNLKVVEVG